MRGLFCSELIDFLDSRLGLGPELLGYAPCDRETCPGPHHLRALAEAATRRTSVPAQALLRLFGEALFDRLVRRFPAFFVGIESTIDLVSRFETHVVDEVHKLDRRARLPMLRVSQATADGLDVTYESSAGLSDLCEGLLIGSTLHFGEPLAVERLGTVRDGDGAVRFRLRPRAIDRVSPAGVEDLAERW